MMRIVVTGSAGIGKTTLAESLASKMQSELVPESYVPNMFKPLKNKADYEEVSEAFEAVLEEKFSGLESEGINTIVYDRSPIDLFNLWLHLGLFSLEKKTLAFQSQCFGKMEHFDFVIFPTFGKFKFTQKSDDTAKRNPNYWVRMMNYSSTYGFTRMATDSKKVIVVPANIEPEHWTDFCIDAIKK
jgi:GTPase SAR1 family protein